VASIRQLLINRLHQRIFIDDAGLPQDDETESLEEIRADIKWLLLADVFFRCLDTFQQQRIQCLNDAVCSIFLALRNDASDTQRENINGLGVAINNFSRKFLKDDYQVWFADLWGDTLDAPDSIRLNFDGLISEMTDKSGTDPLFHGFFQHVWRIEYLVTEVMRTSVAVIFVVVFAIFEHFCYSLRFWHLWSKY
jgi:hypothetical protein